MDSQPHLLNSHTGLSLALVGAPNSGKTSLFNLLTLSHQKVGNFPGVTVEKKTGLINGGALKQNDKTIELTDLPGIYSLTPTSLDEQVSKDFLLHSPTPLNGIIAVADSTQMRRHLPLILELRELGLPVILVLTFQDEFLNQGHSINLEQFSRFIGIPTIFVSSKTRDGIEQLLEKIQEFSFIENPKKIHHPLVASPETTGARLRFVDSILAQSTSLFSLKPKKKHFLDQLFLHPYAGPILTFLIFFFFFQAIFSFSEVPTQLLENFLSSTSRWADSFLNTSLSSLSLFQKNPSFFSLFKDFFTSGVIDSVGAVLIFLPQIIIVFSLLHFLEESGILPRTSLILSRLMKNFGLSGRSFIPLLSSFACAVPGIMATRTIPSRRERLLTIFVAPLMPCSARLPVYTIFISILVPKIYLMGFMSIRGITLFALYLLGLLGAFSISYIYKKTIPPKEKEYQLEEIPSLRMPSMYNLIHSLKHRSFIFLKKAGSLILVLSMALWFLSRFPDYKNPNSSERLKHSYLGLMGQTVEPALRPLGYDWKISVGILSSFAAREVFLSTLSLLDNGSKDFDESGLRQRIVDMKRDSSITGSNTRIIPVFTPPVIVSLLIFYVFAFQCMSTFVIAKKESGSWTLPLTMVAIMLFMAYSSAFLAYRIGSLLLI